MIKKRIVDKTREELDIEDWHFINGLIQHTLLADNSKWVARIQGICRVIDYYEWDFQIHDYQLIYTEKISGKKFPISCVPDIDHNEISVLVIDMEKLDNYRKENHHETENDLSYKEAVKLAKGEYSLFDMVRLMNTAPEFQTFNPETNYYLAVCPKENRIVKGSFDLIN